MNYTFKIVRDVQDKTATLSTCTLTDNSSGEILFKGYGCEPKGPATSLSGKNQRIPTGVYRITWTDSARNGSFTRKYSTKWNSRRFFTKYPQYAYSVDPSNRNVTLWVINGTNFDHRRILIHVGNSAKDTLGCYLLGNSRNTSKMTVSNSVSTMDEFYSLVLELGVENIEVIYSESFK